MSNNTILSTILSTAERHPREVGGIAVLISFIAFYFLNRGEELLPDDRDDRVLTLGLAVPRTVLDPIEWRPFTLVDKERLSHNTARYVILHA